MYNYDSAMMRDAGGVLFATALRIRTKAINDLYEWYGWVPSETIMRDGFLEARILVSIAEYIVCSDAVGIDVTSSNFKAEVSGMVMKWINVFIDF